MKTLIFSVYDQKAEAFITPFFMQNVKVAVRAFSQSVNDSSHMFHMHPDDYQLFLIGEWDDENANFIQEGKQDLGYARDYLEPARQFDMLEELKKLIEEASK